MRVFRSYGNRGRRPSTHIVKRRRRRYDGKAQHGDAPGMNGLHAADRSAGASRMRLDELSHLEQQQYRAASRWG